MNGLWRENWKISFFWYKDIFRSMHWRGFQQVHRNAYHGKITHGFQNSLQAPKQTYLSLLFLHELLEAPSSSTEMSKNRVILAMALRYSNVPPMGEGTSLQISIDEHGQCSSCSLPLSFLDIPPVPHLCRAWPLSSKVAICWAVGRALFSFLFQLQLMDFIYLQWNFQVLTSKHKLPFL